MAEVVTFWRFLRWKESVDAAGELHFTRLDGECRVSIHSEDWGELGEFADGDIDGVAMGRYQHRDDGTTMAELRAALQEMACATNS